MFCPRHYILGQQLDRAAAGSVSGPAEAGEELVAQFALSSGKRRPLRLDCATLIIITYMVHVLKAVGGNPWDSCTSPLT